MPLLVATLLNRAPFSLDLYCFKNSHPSLITGDNEARPWFLLLTYHAKLSVFKVGILFLPSSSTLDMQS
jgi:hypothetical protein